MRKTATFRIDDISLNTDLVRLNNMIDAICERCNVISVTPSFLLPVSLSVFDMSDAPTRHESERIFPAILNAYSDEKEFFKPDICGMPPIELIARDIANRDLHVDFCSHGMFHIDHRLIPYAAQEINILCAQSMVEHHCEKQGLRENNYLRAFVPPFNKVNDDTRTICFTHKIELIEWDISTWKHIGYLKDKTRVDYGDGGFNMFYMHTHDFDSITALKNKLIYLI